MFPTNKDLTLSKCFELTKVDKTRSNLTLPPQQARALGRRAALYDESTKLYVSKTLEGVKAKRDVPALAICGNGRAGKDLAAELLCNWFKCQFANSTSQAVLPIIADITNTPQEEAFEKRHNNRMFWFEFCNGLRDANPTLIVRLVLSSSDIVVGIRSFAELKSVTRPGGLVDASVWIDNPRVDKDPTVEYTMDECDFVIRNNGTKSEYADKLLKFGKLYYNLKDGV